MSSELLTSESSAENPANGGEPAPVPPTAGNQPASIALQFFAQVISVAFHPLFIGMLMAAFVVYAHPSFFNGFSRDQRNHIMLIFIYNSVFFPLFVVFLLRGVKFISSIQLKSRRDRIIPYITSTVFFFWSFWVFHNKPEIPSILSQISLGMLFAASLMLIANNYFKISMHAAGVGGLFAMMLLILFSGTMSMGIPLTAPVLICGLVCSSRLVASDHTLFEVVAGFIVGMASQFAASWFIQ